MKNKLIFLIIISLFLSSCISTTKRAEQTKNEIDNIDIYLTADELIIEEEHREERIVEIYKDEIQDNCERKFFEVMNYYENGDYEISRVVFSNVLENLEYLYGDKKVSDKVMLQNFWNKFDDDKIKSSGINIFSIYESLFSEDSHLADGNGNGNGHKELVVEKAAETIKVKQNNKSFVYLEDKVKLILSKRKLKAKKDFIKDVYDSYNDYLADRVGIKEIYMRSLNYKNFINKQLSKEKLDNILFYVPAIMTSYYNGRNNGGIWRVENLKIYRKIRGDVGASTAMVIRNVKKLSKKKSILQVIATILSNGKYGLNQKEVVKNIYTEDMADFLAMVVILSNPRDHGLKDSQLTNKKEKDYFASYNKYLKNPKKYVSSKKSSSSKSNYSKSYIRIKYKVRKNDHLDKIAKLFKVKISDIKKWNPRSTSRKYLYPGTEIYLRGYKFQHYKARSGDSIDRICRKFKMYTTDFKKINNLSKNTIYKGRRYIVRKR
ncbi:MAG: LysM peptidoglycan-binding domain-containing protein [Candidatus Delongbacteria bacterium]|nr:LysM peptidoglycan-binding domain-containing protein [Candidatus Delongbacteria bacterium]